MIQPIQTEDKKLLCPRCKKEVNEYPPNEMDKGKFTCVNCNSKVEFIRQNDEYFSWVVFEF